MSDAETTGIVLAAGAGSRMGRPKITVPGWLADACAALLDGGCGRVVVVTGAAPAPALPSRLEASTTAVRCARWADGLAASLRTAAAATTGVDDDARVALHLVDCPGVDAAVVRRVLVAARDGGVTRAVFDGVPGHPVVLTAGMLRRLAPRAHGDRGLGPVLAAAGVPVRGVECADLADGRDIDVANVTGRDGGSRVGAA